MLKSFLNEISKLPSLSEALSKFTQCEEYERNVKSLKQRYADATENLTRHVSNEKERQANLKKRWNLELGSPSPHKNLLGCWNVEFRSGASSVDVFNHF